MRVFSLLASLLLASVAFAQVPVQAYGPAYGPYVPLVTTPQVSLSTVWPNPVGARNATYGLSAGARNSTFETGDANTGSTYTVPVWYQGGGAPVISDRIALFPHQMHGGPMMMMHHEMRMEHHEGPEASRQWAYLPAQEIPSAGELLASGKGARKAARTITNQDIDAENQKTGTVKYSGKTEKLQ